MLPEILDVNTEVNNEARCCQYFKKQ